VGYSVIGSSESKRINREQNGPGSSARARRAGQIVLLPILLSLVGLGCSKKAETDADQRAIASSFCGNARPPVDRSCLANLQTRLFLLAAHSPHEDRRAALEQFLIAASNNNRPAELGVEFYHLSDNEPVIFDFDSEDYNLSNVYGVVSVSGSIYYFVPETRDEALFFFNV
jgi:hypothetical protein